MNARKVITVMIGTALAGGVAYFVFLNVRAYPCKQLEDRMCAFAGVACDNIKLAFKNGKPSPEACRRGNEGMDGIKGVPTDLQVIMVTKIVSEVFGMQKMDAAMHDAVMLLREIEVDLQKHRSPDAHMKKLIAVGPMACSTVLVRLSEGKDSEEMGSILREVLIGLRGKDLGDEFQPWQEWCSQVFKANRDPK